jgi:hypothetical protein
MLLKDVDCPRCGGRVVEELEGRYCMTCDWFEPAPIRLLTEIEKNTERPHGFVPPKRIPHPDGREGK